jgi:hypothetical protein
MFFYFFLSQYNAFRKDPSSHNKSNLEGQIYEFICYNHIIEKYSNINILKTYSVKKEQIRNFSYNKLGKINYHSNGIHLAEFDILGYNKDNIFFWEITKSEQGKKILRNEIERKVELLNRIFPNKNIIFHLILPRKIVGYENNDIEIIKEPNYSKYINSEYLKISKYVNDCSHLIELSNIATDYSYIEEIINLSFKYFGCSNIIELHEQHLIERIYDMNGIKKDKFMYYSIENQKYGEIEIRKDKIYRDNVLIKGIKKCVQEVKIIKMIENANKHIA